MSLLTSYRPNFCCECGNKIVRLRWFVWTSRRFCDKCLRVFARRHWLRPSLTILSFVLFGVLIGRGSRHVPPPLVIERPAIAPAQSSNPPTPNSNSATPARVAPQPTDQIYICGARTKKGTPCSRRVHGPVRCWQHKGALAMLPPEKLVVKE